MLGRMAPRPRGKAALPLWEELKSVFPGVQCERRFPWLALPRGDEASLIEARIRSALIKHCRETLPDQTHPKKRECSPELLASKLLNPPRAQLEFDFFIPQYNLAIEFDERQHFTLERAASLEAYDGKVSTGYDQDAWLQKCRSICAVDPDPIWRDWQRAYRDAVRDIRAAENGVALVRYAYDDQPSIDALKDDALKNIARN